MLSKIRGKGWTWMGIKVELAKHMPEDLADRDELAQNLVPRALDEVFGVGKWTKERRPKKSGVGEVVWIVVK